MPSDPELPGKPRVDGQITGLAGEFFVAAELLKRGFQTSVTFGNAKSIDLFATNPETGRMFTVQVKTIRKKNVFPISHEKVQPNCIYVFVILNRVDAPVQYFVVPGATLKDGAVYAESERLHIFASGKSVDAAMEDFSCQLAHFFEHYTNLAGDEVVGMAAQLREIYLAEFEARR